MVRDSRWRWGEEGWQGVTQSVMPPSLMIWVCFMHTGACSPPRRAAGLGGTQGWKMPQMLFTLLTLSHLLKGTNNETCYLWSGEGVREGSQATSD